MTKGAVDGKRGTGHDSDELPAPFLSPGIC